jgi:hypothetical protein
MTEPKIIPVEEIAQYSLDEIEALQDKFKGCSFWRDDITHIDREGIRLTRDTLDAMDARLSILSQESNARLTKTYNESAALCVTLARHLCNDAEFQQASDKIRTEFNRLPQLEMADEARAHLKTGHEYVEKMAEIWGVNIPPLQLKATR